MREKRRKSGQKGGKGGGGGGVGLPLVQVTGEEKGAEGRVRGAGCCFACCQLPLSFLICPREGRGGVADVSEFGLLRGREGGGTSSIVHCVVWIGNAMVVVADGD